MTEDWTRSGAPDVNGVYSCAAFWADQTTGGILRNARRKTLPKPRSDPAANPALTGRNSRRRRVAALSHTSLDAPYRRGNGCKLAGAQPFCSVVMDHAGNPLKSSRPGLTHAKSGTLLPANEDAAVAYLHGQDWCRAGSSRQKLSVVDDQLNGEATRYDRRRTHRKHCQASLYGPSRSQGGNIHRRTTSWGLGITLLGSHTGLRGVVPRSARQRSPATKSCAGISDTVTTLLKATLGQPSRDAELGANSKGDAATSTHPPAPP